MFSEYNGNDQSQTAEDIVRWCLGFTFSITIIQLCHPSSHTEWLFALVYFKYFLNTLWVLNLFHLMLQTSSNVILKVVSFCQAVSLSCVLHGTTLHRSSPVYFHDTAVSVYFWISSTLPLLIWKHHQRRTL